MLAAGCIHLLPDASEELKKLDDYPLGSLLAYSTVILLLVVHMLAEYIAIYSLSRDRTDTTELVQVVSKRDAAIGAALSQQLTSNSPRRWAAAIVLVVALGFHSFLVGASLGVQKEVKTVTEIFVPILAHKSLAAVALGSSIVKAHAPNHVFYTLITLFSLATPLGIVAGLAIARFSGDQLWAAICQALASGTFIYVAVFEIMPDALTVKDGLMRLLIRLLCLVVGYGLMAALAVWV